MDIITEDLSKEDLSQYVTDLNNKITSLEKELQTAKANAKAEENYWWNHYKSENEKLKKAERRLAMYELVIEKLAEAK
jgi:hypothetical protein